MSLVTAAAGKAATTAAAAPQQLPPKYDAQFKQVVKLYEGKSYKKALKSADTLLKTFPDHGETLSMKGLILTCIDKKEWPAGTLAPQAYAKSGLMKNLKSHVCWHVLGLLHRGDRSYGEAIKCYRNALKYDADNLQILRDLATLQSQTRDAHGLIETRNKLLELKPQLKGNWLGMAVAHHLAGNNEVAFEALKAFEAATEATESKVEISELQLYKIQVLMDGKDYAAALKCLHEVSRKILDDLVCLTLQAECEYQTGDKASAAVTNVALLGINPNCPNALKGYARAKASFTLEPFDFRSAGLTAGQRAELLQILDNLGKTIDSRNLQRQCIDLATGPDLRRRLDDFARPYVRSNIPSLFSALKSLYTNPDSVAVVETLFFEWKDELTKHGKFEKDDAPNPTCLLWVLIYLSMHFIRLGDLPRAKALIEEAIVHSPTVEKLYSVRAKILKHEGDAVGAAEQANMARKLDLADRYLANRCVKCMLRANQIDEAEKTYAIFSRQKEGEVLSNIVELQCMWFEVELGDSYYRQGDLRSALQTFLLIEHHFTDFKEDQFDFHGYCLRKYTLRAYSDMVRFHDESAKHPVYLNAARRVVRCYLDIAAVGNPDAVTAKVVEHARKVNAQTDCALGKIPALDKPMEDCVPFLQALQKYAADDVRTHSLAAEVYLKKGKMVLAMKAAMLGAKLPGAAKDKAFVALVKTVAEGKDAAQEFLKEFRAVPHIKALLI